MVNSYHPTSLSEALEILSKKSLTPYAGGTDLMINGDENAKYLFLNKVPDMKYIVEDKECIRIGAACTLTDTFESKLTPAILKRAISQIAAPAIRNLATCGGNICNGSAKGDTTLIFFATNSKLRLASSKGERIIPISEFYLGGKKTSLKSDELLVEILMDKTALNNYYYKKVGARNALAISRLSFAAILKIDDGKIVNCIIAFGAISDVIISCKYIDVMFIGKTIKEAKAIKEDYLYTYGQEIVPTEGRISSEYRKTVCMNLLRDFLESNGI